MRAMLILTLILMEWPINEAHVDIDLDIQGSILSKISGNPDGLPR